MQKPTKSLLSRELELEPNIIIGTVVIEPNNYLDIRNVYS
jgi:hypothetical protein